MWIPSLPISVNIWEEPWEKNTKIPGDREGSRSNRIEKKKDPTPGPGLIGIQKESYCADSEGPETSGHSFRTGSGIQSGIRPVLRCRRAGFLNVGPAALPQKHRPAVLWRASGTFIIVQAGFQIKGEL